GLVAQTGQETELLARRQAAPLGLDPDTAMSVLPMGQPQDDLLPETTMILSTLLVDDPPIGRVHAEDQRPATAVEPDQERERPSGPGVRYIGFSQDKGARLERTEPGQSKQLVHLLPGGVVLLAVGDAHDVVIPPLGPCQHLDGTSPLPFAFGHV